MKVKKIVLKIASLLYRKKIVDFITYVKVAFTNYIAFILSLINMMAILRGIVLPRLNVRGFLADVITLISLVVLLVIGIGLGWFDTNAGITRKVVEKQAYWRKPHWAVASRAVGRIYPLPEVVVLWKLLEERGELDEEAKKCLRITAKNTVSWVANSYKGITKSTSMPLPECMEFYLKKAGAKEINVEELVRLLEMPEYR